MKKIILVLLIFGLVQADAKPNSWNKFFGVEAGAGVFGLSLAFLLAYNVSPLPDFPMGFGYTGGVMVGWQKRKSEQTAMRHILGFNFSYVPKVTSINSGGTYTEWCIFNCKDAKTFDFDHSTGQTYTAYYAFDGLLDFVHSGDQHFGIILGGALNFGVTGGRVFERTPQAESPFGITVTLGFRTGLYWQVGQNILDLTASLPFGGVGGGYVLYPNILTLGYKHLF